MEPGEALSTAAQIAVALAGFAGVVVVFRRESVHEWSTLDKFRLRLLLANSILPLGHNVALLGAFWPFFTGIVLQLVAAMFQFARMILLPPE